MLKSCRDVRDPFWHVYGKKHCVWGGAVKTLNSLIARNLLSSATYELTVNGNAALKEAEQER